MTATIGSVHMTGSVCTAALLSNIMGISGSTVTSGVGGPSQINISIADSDRCGRHLCYHHNSKCVQYFCRIYSGNRITNFSFADGVCNY